MSTRRNAIIQRLREARGRAHRGVGEIEYLPMIPRKHETAAERLEQFTRRAKSIDCVIHRHSSAAEAVAEVERIIGDDSLVLSWAFRHIPLPGLEEALTARGVQAIARADPTVRVGITGVDAALAETGSIVLEAGKGKPRVVSILPSVHIAVMRAHEDVLPDMESWIDEIKRVGGRAIRESSSILIITGPSRTADIAMEPVRGMHGPGEVHLIILE